ALLPVLVVAVRDENRHGAAERAPVADAGADLGRVGLDLHPPAAAVPELAPRHVAVERPAGGLDPRGPAPAHPPQSRAGGRRRCRETKLGHSDSPITSRLYAPLPRRGLAVRRFQARKGILGCAVVLAALAAPLSAPPVASAAISCQFADNILSVNL